MNCFNCFILRYAAQVYLSSLHDCIFLWFLIPFYLFPAPFQPPTEEWGKIMKETREQVEKVENDFTAVCQAKKVCKSMKHSILIMRMHGFL